MGASPDGSWRWLAEPDALEALHRALDSVWAAHADVDPADRAALALALSELLTNAIEHGRATWVVLDLTVEDDRLRAALHDDGVELPTAAGSAFVTDDPLAEGGRGLALAHHFADLAYRRERDGNAWSVVRHRV